MAIGGDYTEIQVHKKDWIEGGKCYTGEHYRAFAKLILNELEKRKLPVVIDWKKEEEDGKI